MIIPKKKNEVIKGIALHEENLAVVSKTGRFLFMNNLLHRGNDQHEWIFIPPTILDLDIIAKEFSVTTMTRIQRAGYSLHKEREDHTYNPPYSTLHTPFKVNH